MSAKKCLIFNHLPKEYFLDALKIEYLRLYLLFLFYTMLMKTILLLGLLLFAVSLAYATETNKHQTPPQDLTSKPVAELENSEKTSDNPIAIVASSATSCFLEISHSYNHSDDFVLLDISKELFRPPVLA